MACSTCTGQSNCGCSNCHCNEVDVCKDTQEVCEEINSKLALLKDYVCVLGAQTCQSIIKAVAKYAFFVWCFLRDLTHISLKVNKNVEELLEQQKQLVKYVQNMAEISSAKADIVGENKDAGIVVSGKYNESKKGSMGYFEDIKVIFEKEGYTAIKWLGWGSSTEIKDVKDGEWSSDGFLKKFKAGTTFKMTNTGETDDGKKIDFKVTIVDTGQTDSGKEPILNIKPVGSSTYRNVFFEFTYITKLKLRFDLLNQEDGQPINGATAIVITDVDNEQKSTTKFQATGSGVALPKDTDLEVKDGVVSAKNTDLEDIESIPKGAYIAYGGGTYIDYEHVGSHFDYGHNAIFQLFGSSNALKTLTNNPPELALSCTFDECASFAKKEEEEAGKAKKEGDK